MDPIKLSLEQPIWVNFAILLVPLMLVEWFFRHYCRPLFYEKRFGFYLGRYRAPKYEDRILFCGREENYKEVHFGYVYFICLIHFSSASHKKIPVTGFLHIQNLNCWIAHVLPNFLVEWIASCTGSLHQPLVMAKKNKKMLLVCRLIANQHLGWFGRGSCKCYSDWITLPQWRMLIGWNSISLF